MPTRKSNAEPEYPPAAACEQPKVLLYSIIKGMETSVCDSIGDNIKTIRLARNITQQELALRSDLTPSYISKLEQKKLSISLKSLNRIAKTLDIDTKELITLHETQKKEKRNHLAPRLRRI